MAAPGRARRGGRLAGAVPGKGHRAGRRVGLGQVDAGPAAGRAVQADLGRRAAARPAVRGDPGPGLPAARQRRAADPAGPVRLVQPDAQGRHPPGAGGPHPRARAARPGPARGAAGPDRRAAAAGPPAAGRAVPGEVPARAVRRPAAAGLHRPRPGRPAVGHPGRRAGVEPGRVDPARGAEPAGRADHGAAGGTAVRHPRRGLGPVLRGGGRRHVRRAADRERPRGDGDQRARPPLHPAADLLGPGPGPPRGHRGRRGPRPAAQPHHPPSGCRFHPRCPLAMPRCAEQAPPVFELGGGHWTRCWLYGTDGNGPDGNNPPDEPEGTT